MNNKNSMKDNPPPPPILRRQSRQKCLECQDHTSLSSHLYCNICAGNHIEEIDDLRRDLGIENLHKDNQIRNEIILYHLLNTYRNRLGIFNQPAENDNNWIKKYLKVLCNNIENPILQVYLNKPIILEKCNPENDYF